VLSLLRARVELNVRVSFRSDPTNPRFMLSSLMSSRAVSAAAHVVLSNKVDIVIGGAAITWVPAAPMPITNCLLIRRLMPGAGAPGNAELGREFAPDGSFASGARALFDRRPDPNRPVRQALSSRQD
jgi:hypothetical protein